MGVPHSLGNLAWGCQILGGAKSPVTPVPYRFSNARFTDAGTGRVSTLMFHNIVTSPFFQGIRIGSA